MASTSLTVKPLLNHGLKLPESDNVEKVLLLIDKHEASLEVETQEVSLGLKLLDEILADMNAIQLLQNVTN
jgi:hypothetical protein